MKRSLELTRDFLRMSFQLVGNPPADRLRTSRSDNKYRRTSAQANRLVHYFFAALIIILLPPPAFAIPADEAVERIQKAYEDIKDMKGSFVQKNVIKDLNKINTYNGEFFVKRPLKMKWAYKGKASQDLLINNDTVVIHKKGDNQAYRSKFNKETYGQSPVVLLPGMGNIREEFTISGTEKVLTLKPRKAMAGIVSITLHLSDADFPIRAFTIQDGRSNVVEIELKDVKINTDIRDSLFDLNLPKGVNIYEQP